MTLFVRELVDPNGDPLTIYSPGTTHSAAAALSTTCTITATLSSTVDLSSSLVEGSGTYGVGSLVIPGWGGAYTVTSSNARFPGGNTPGISVTFTTPSNTAVAQSVTVTYSVSGTSRRFYHNPFVTPTFVTVDGLVVEPSSTVGQSTTITYAWDPATQSVSVSSYSGSATVRDHGPGDAATYGLPLYFSPELRADGSFSTAAASHVRGLLAIPSATRTMMGGRGVVADVVRNMSTTGTGLFESISWRGVFDTTADSGILGLTTGNYAAARSTPSTPSTGVDGKVMLHELGHAFDQTFLPSIGHPDGIDPYVPPDGTVDTYWSPGGALKTRAVISHDANFEYVWVRNYDTDGTTLLSEFYFSTPLGQGGRISGEAGFMTIFKTIQDSGVYFRSEPDEYFAQCCMLFWALRISGFSATTAWNDLVNEVGGITAYNSFVSYMQGIGAFP